ncbi:unnamed protein product [Cyclocybe aegerita]|uniref:Uncharacterized protein n=1 Tax=Cyclocybe aegerita TaxID=1973307 RepID=A0A8S0WT25_CYCAE|nr:unnamed protein product [Cyclocybe aegerita]
MSFPIPPLSGYERAMLYHLNEPLDPSRGHAIILNGDIFFSPNSQRTIRAPPTPEDPLRRKPYKNSLRPVYNYIPELFNYPGTDRPKGVSMSPEQVLAWARFEKNIKTMFQSLSGATSILRVEPIIDTACGCAGTYHNAHDFYCAEKRLREWFSLWVAMLSYAIAVLQAPPNLTCKSVALPTWYQCLHKDSWDDITLSCLQQNAAQFTNPEERVRCFVDIGLNPAHRTSVDWLCHFNIPVWYPWGVQQSSSQDNFMKHLAPLPEQLQLVMTFFNKQPNASTGPKPWEAHFASIEKQIALSRNTAELRQCGPDKNTKVYLWEKTHQGTYSRVFMYKSKWKDTLERFGRNQKHYNPLLNEWDCREDLGELDPEERQANYYYGGSDDKDGVDLDLPSIPANADTLNRRVRSVSPPSPAPRPSSPHQASPIASARPCSSHLLPQITSNPAEGTRTSDAPASDPPPTPVVQPLQSSTTRLSNSVGRLSDCDIVPERYSPLEMLYLFWGFTSPPSASSTSYLQMHFDNFRVSNLIKGIGVLSLTDNFLQSRTGMAALDFFRCLTETQSTPLRNELFDLSISNLHKLPTSGRLRFVRKFLGDLFVFAFGNAATVPWRLAVMSARDALFVCRLELSMKDFEICLELLQCGMQFCTLLPLPEFMPVPSPEAPLALRPPKHVFSTHDYEAYIQDRTSLLRNPRVGRAALRRGSILWRLAITVVSFQDVLNGPTMAVTLDHQCEMYKPGDKKLWCDDVLGDTEIEMLCGIYCVPTGYGTQMSTVSWWPTNASWWVNVGNTCWNNAYEKIFEDRLAAIKAGEAQPLPPSAWRLILQPYSHIRRAHTTAELLASQFMRQQLRG